MALSFKSIVQAKQVLKVISEEYMNGRTVIKGRGTLDRIIEKVKFPYTAEFKTYGHIRSGNGYIPKKLGTACAYKNQQYDPIRNWLVDNKYLNVQDDGYRYYYTLTEKGRLANSL